LGEEKKEERGEEVKGAVSLGTYDTSIRDG
jgi:hypothetical protein